jgi:hypothetical protein
MSNAMRWDGRLTVPLVLLAFLLAAAAVPADDGEEATVGQVLAACERAAAAGGRALDAAICDWYLLPCGCHAPGDGTSAGPRWCVPSAEGAAETLAAVVAELRHAPDPTAPVEPAVAQILARLYPCPPTQP